MGRGALPRRRGLGLVMTGWLLAACRTSGATQSPPASPPPTPEPAAIPEPAATAEPAAPQPACTPASGPFDERAIVAEIDALHRDLALTPTPKGSEPSTEPRVEKKKAQPDDWITLDPLDEQERRLCSLYLRYVRDGSSEDLRRELRHRHVQLLSRHRYLDEAIESAEAFVLDSPDHALTLPTVEMLVDALAILAFVGERRVDSRERLLGWIERLPTMPVWKRPGAEELRTVAAKLRVGLLVARARDAHDADPPDYQACARDYQAAVEPNIGQPIDMLLHGAADCLELAGDHAGAAARRDEARRRVPESE